MAQLRTSIDEATFLSRVKTQFLEGYRLVVVEEARTMVAIAGFRQLHCLPLGKFMYVDDFVTAEEHRKQGFGKILFAWLEGFARENRCAAIQLDSGTQRHAAHRFYEQMKMEMTCHHYTKIL